MVMVLEYALDNVQPRDIKPRRHSVTGKLAALYLCPVFVRSHCIRCNHLGEKDI